MIWIYVVIGVGLVVAAVWLGYMVWRKDAADLARYLNRDGCPWERISRTSATPEAPELVYYHNVGPDASGVEMRAYDYSQFPGQGEYDEDGICLSVIDNSSGHGVVLNEFGRVLDALRFGDELWRGHVPRRPGGDAADDRGRRRRSGTSCSGTSWLFPITILCRGG